MTAHDRGAVAGASWRSSRDGHDAADRALRSRDVAGSHPCGQGSDLLREPLDECRLTAWCSTTELQPRIPGRPHEAAVGLMGIEPTSSRPRFSIRADWAPAKRSYTPDGNAGRTSNGEALTGFRTARLRSQESLHGSRTHGAGREDRTLLGLCVRQVSSPDDVLRRWKNWRRLRRRDSNPHPSDSKSRILPLEYSGMGSMKRNGRCGQSRTVPAGLMRPASLRGTQRRRSEPPGDTLYGERQEVVALERSPGIAPGFRAWRALVLLLNYDRISSRPRELHSPFASLPVRCPALWAWTAGDVPHGWGPSFKESSTRWRAASCRRRGRRA